MRAFLTSCNRGNYLKETLKSLEGSGISLITIHEDCDMKDMSFLKEIDIKTRVVKTHMGQIRSIAHFVNNANDKYYLHLEDDWIFSNKKKDFIKDSIEIMEKDPNIIKVLARGEHHMNTEIKNGIEYITETEHYGQLWHGFSWNPGVTRLDLLKDRNLYQSEHGINLDVHSVGYRCAYLPYELYLHIGKNSTR